MVVCGLIGVVFLGVKVFGFFLVVGCGVLVFCWCFFIVQLFEQGGDCVYQMVCCFCQGGWFVGMCVQVCYIDGIVDEYVDWFVQWLQVQVFLVVVYDFLCVLLCYWDQWDVVCESELYCVGFVVYWLQIGIVGQCFFWIYDDVVVVFDEFFGLFYCLVC